MRKEVCEPRTEEARKQTWVSEDECSTQKVQQAQRSRLGPSGSSTRPV